MTTNTVKHTPDATDSIADDLLRNGYERWLRLEEEKAAIGDDLKELFAELKAQGFAPKALRESFRRVRNADNADQQEHDAIVDLYVASLTRARPARTREASYSEAKGREYPNDFDLSDNESREMRGFVAGLTDEQKAAALAYDGEDGPIGELTDTQESDQPDEAVAPATAAVASDEMAAQDDVGATASSTDSHSHRTPARADMVEASTDKQAAGASRPTNSNSQASPLKPADSAGEAPSSSQASPAAHSDDEPFEPVAFLRQPKPLRPDCMHPGNCAGYGSTTCYSCKVAASQREAVEA